MVDIREKLFDVAFQNPASAGVVAARLMRKQTKSIQSSMATFSKLTRKRIGDKSLSEKGIKSPIDGVMEKSVPDARLVDVPGFRVADVKGLIFAVFVSMIPQIFME